MKRKSVGSEVVEAMEEVFAIVQGKAKPAAGHTFPPSVALEVRKIRAATGLSRAEFARRYILDARAYLTVLSHRPKAVEEAVAG